MNVTAEDAMKRYLELVEEDSYKADAFMLSWLRLNPSAPGELIRMMDLDRKGERLSSKKQLNLWRLIAEAGTPNAQRAIIDAAMNPSYGRDSHIRGMMYATNIENPEPFVVDGLWRLHREPSLNGDSEIAGATREMSLLSVGALGYRDKQNEDLKEGIRRQLSENLSRTTDAGEKALTLSAIGNSGNAGLMETVAPYLASSDETLRGAAFDALRRMEDPKAQELLIGSYASQTSPEVKAAAIKALSEMPPQESSTEWARKAVQTEPDLRVQALMINYLGSTMQEFPRNETALRALLKSRRRR
jgi:hypothetical protein